MCDREAFAKTTPSAISPESATIFFAECGEDHRRKLSDARHGPQARDEVAHIGERLARRDAERAGSPDRG